MVLSLEKKTHFPTVRVPLDDFGLCRNFTSARRMLSSDMTFSFCLCLRWETPNHGPKKQFLTGVRLTIAIFGLMNIQNLQPLACPLSQPTSLCRIFLRCSAGRSPRPSPHRAKLTRGMVEILWAMNKIPLLMGFVGVEYEYTPKNTHIREAYQLTSIMTWDRGIFNGSVLNKEQIGGWYSNPQSQIEKSEARKLWGHILSLYIHLSYPGEKFSSFCWDPILYP